jgi:ATP phosphoribosyltransferase
MTRSSDYEEEKEVMLVLPKNTGLKEYTQLFMDKYPEYSEHKVVEVRGEDVPFWISQLTRKGKKVYGFTGGDLYREYELENPDEELVEVIDVMEWNDPNALYSKPALCLIGPVEMSIEDMPKEITICASKKYRYIVKEYLKRYEEKGYSFNEVYVNGSVEASCSEGISDLAIDIVYSGRSMKECGLRIYDVIFKSDCVILGGKGNGRT